MSAINNLFVGENNADAFYIGSEEVEVIYLGSEVVYQKGEFVGIKMKSSVDLAVESGSSYNLKITSSEPWTLNVDTAVTWLDFSQMTGATGETVVVVSTNEENQTGSDRTTTITATTANYSATCVVTQYYVDFVDYISTSALTSGPTNTRIDTGIIPTTATTFRVQGMYKGHSQGNVIVGYSYNDSRDYRLFWAGADGRPDVYFDFNSGRLGPFIMFESSELIDITCGNFYIDTVTGATQTTIDDPHSIMIDVGSWWVKSLEIWDGNTKVFDGHAAKIGNNVGLYDSITRQMFTNQNLNIVEHTMHCDLYVEQPPSQESYVDPYPYPNWTTFYKSNARTYEISAGEEVMVIGESYMAYEHFCTIKASGGEYNSDTYFTIQTIKNGEKIGIYQNGTIIKSLSGSDDTYTINGLTIRNATTSNSAKVRLSADASANWWDITYIKD